MEWIRIATAVLFVGAPLLATAGCGRSDDETRAYYRTSGGEVEVELDDDVEDEVEDMNDDAEDLGEEIEDEIIEDAEGPFE